MIIQHNMPAITAHGKLSAASRSVDKSSEKLSTGYRINRAADDAAGLAVSEKMRSQLRGIKQAIKNTQNGAALIQTFEGALGQTVSIIHRMKELAVQSANGNYSDSVDRQTIQVEYRQLCDEVNHIAETDFNGVVMLSEKPDVDNLALEKVINSQDLAVIAMQRSAQSGGAAKLFSAAQTQALAFSARSAVQCGDLSVSGGTLNTDFRYENNTLTILTDTPIAISGTSRADHIFVERNVNANITLSNVDIRFNDGDESRKIDGTCAFEIADNSKGNVNVNLNGTNNLSSGVRRAGLQKNGMGGVGTLTITGNGKLTVHGGAHGAGIGSGKEKNGCENITIESGIIYAYCGTNDSSVSGNCGAGIGSGCDGDVKNIMIKGGKILAVGGSRGGAGIGSAATTSRNSKSSDIVISGGVVVAIGGGTGESDKNPRTTGAGPGIGAGGCFHAGTSSGIRISGDDTIVISKGGRQRSGKYAEDFDTCLDDNGKKGTSSDPVQWGSLVDEKYSGTIFGVNIKDGTIVHGNPGTVPDFPVLPEPPDTPDIPLIPGNPDNPDNPDSSPSKRPAFTEGSAEMTYTDELILQTNSRSKDAVMFTFRYSAEGIGELKNDLNCTAKGLGLDELSLATQESANYAIDKFDHALCKATIIRATFGSAMNRLEHKTSNLTSMDENLTTAESGVRDTDMALEMMSYTKGQIVMSAAQSMLAQANTQKQGVLNLLTE